jgi:hypothetical protein
MVKGIDRTPTTFDETFNRSAANFARTYTWIEYHTNNNIFTVWPNHETLLTMYADDYFKNNTWIWDGKPHWAYEKSEFMILEKDRKAIEWTPNTIDADIHIEGQVVHIQLTSDTPNLKEYQIKKTPFDNWLKVDDELKLDLTENTHEIVFRTVNLASVAGPEYRIRIENN